jgi:hypothetical protein
MIFACPVYTNNPKSIVTQGAEIVARDMRTVAVIIHGITTTGYRIDSMNIIDISVAIIINVVICNFERGLPTYLRQDLHVYNQCLYQPLRRLYPSSPYSDPMLAVH